MKFRLFETKFEYTTDWHLQKYQLGEKTTVPYSHIAQKPIKEEYLYFEHFDEIKIMIPIQL